MTRTSRNVIDLDGFVKDGFDYRFQVWVQDYKVLPCAHPLRMREMGGHCCEMNKYAGLDVRELYKSNKPKEG